MKIIFINVSDGEFVDIFNKRFLVLKVINFVVIFICYEKLVFF